MNRNLLIGLVVVLVILAAGGYYLSQKNSAAPATTSTDTTEMSPSDMASMTPATDSSTPASSESATMVDGVKTFTVTSQGLKFTPTTLTVKKGDKVKITYHNNVGNHNLTIDEFNAKTPTIGAGQEASIEFTADKTGDFVYYCSIPGHRQAGMFGTLTVTE